MNILYINRSDSACGSCGKSADPHAVAHDVRLGYNPGEGCHAVFTHVSSHYMGDEITKRVQEMRPDLIWVDPLEGLTGQRIV